MTDDALPKVRKHSRTSLWLIGFGLLVLLLAGIALPQHGPQKNGCQYESGLQMQQIAIAAALYRDDHAGSYPERLSQLVPNYISERGFYFHCKYGEAFTPPLANTEPKLIDAFSPYAISALGDGRAVVFERLPMWSDHTVGYFLVSGDVQSLQTMQRNRVSQVEFAKNYLKLFNP